MAKLMVKLMVMQMWVHFKEIYYPCDYNDEDYCDAIVVIDVNLSLKEVECQDFR